ncbi:flagellar basal body P-ring protein FlgI [Chthonobacter albigriseus]|uniref:flagellar basal body P-ring protein FlgI n=1 Tax=Chthonobacter albigriseus TaxID=1683161 RepID=UPI001FCE363C|nr:flagellar basal body P-ring protein FlgI [Chthonobacter albigriseus]
MDRTTMRNRWIGLVGLAVLTLVSLTGAGNAASRIKDIVDVEGVRENQLIGYGLVVGLQGTGDSLNNSPFTKQSLQTMFEMLGKLNIRDANIRTANSAAVIVTANLPPFGTAGARIDVTVSAIGDAKSLQGGTLLVTPLIGATGEVFAIAQGPIAIGGFQASGDAATITRGVPTQGRIANGAVIEKEIPYTLAAQTSLRLSLRNPDFTTARRIALSINDLLGDGVSEPLDPATVRVTVPERFRGNIVDLLTDIEQLIVEPDLPAKVVVDEATGIIVMGQEVRVSTVAVAQGNLTVLVTEDIQVSQPNPLAEGETVAVPRTTLEVQDGREKKMAVVRSGISLQELVDGLNALGLGPRDLISILQAIKAAGALQAEIEVL